ncbi:Vacuolar import and degradation protein [Apiospora kogelbergensis]|uniref:Vacuolar import and degradation protein n=1 Tax=Apiospora kogelbergensis TaxID=1337665 RepID=UPI003130D29C
MPTPSSNPPPALPPRSHSSACPDEWRASTTTSSSSWHTADAVRGNGSDEQESSSSSSTHPDGGSGEDAIMSPGSSTSHNQVTMDDDMDSRSNAESPRPDSRSGGFSTAQTTPAPPDHHHHHDLDNGALASTSSKVADDDDEMAETPEVGAASRSRGGRGQVREAQTRDSAATTPLEGMTPTAVADSDKTAEAGSSVMSNMIQHEYCDPRWATASPIAGSPETFPAFLQKLVVVVDILPNAQIIPTSYSSFLRPGSKFHGTQQSERQIYDVQVEVKHVDFEASFMCGYLKIQGLTEDNPSLTTYFEGEIIGSKYNFLTKHDSWGANEKIDLNHWNKFTAFRPYAKHARKGPVHIKDLHNKENIFMRWKEHFLVPDHRVRTINGASFEGFYYICFNQKEGGISGIYFHSRSEKFQQLELKHVENRGCFGAMEFR